MPMRKSHAKSRNGCNQCKARRVKCDEQLPTCTRCLKRNETCSFATTTPTTATPHTPPSHPSDPISDRCPRQTLELELMHHWTTNTYNTISPSLSQNSGALPLQLPLKGLSHPYLLDSVFSFTALHLASLSPPTAPTRLSTALHYRDSGMQRVAPLMAHPAPSDIFALFWFSVLIGMITMAYTVLTPPTPRHFTTMLVKLGQLWRGTTVIAHLASTLLAGDFYTAVGATAPDRAAPPIPLPDDTESHLALLASFIAASTTDPLYTRAHILLRKAFQTWLAQQRLDDLMAWAPELGQAFAEALSAGEPVALLCTLVYGVALHEAEGRWWARGAGRGVVCECSVALWNADEEWRGLIAWARRRVGLGVGIPVAPQDL